jgi:hypothetical protein
VEGIPIVYVVGVDLGTPHEDSPYPANWSTTSALPDRRSLVTHFDNNPELCASRLESLDGRRVGHVDLSRVAGAMPEEKYLPGDTDAFFLARNFVQGVGKHSGPASGGMFGMKVKNHRFSAPD